MGAIKLSGWLTDSYARGTATLAPFRLYFRAMEATAAPSLPPSNGGLLERLIPLAPWLDANTVERGERTNATARVVWSLLGCACGLVANVFHPIHEGLIVGLGAALLFSVGYFVAVRRSPVPSRIRRVAALLYDNLIVSYVSSFGGIFAIFVALHFQTTVAWGIRFGPAYVVRTALIAVGAVSYNLIFNKYWQEHRVFGLAVIFGVLTIAATLRIVLREVASLHAQLSKQAQHAFAIARQDALTGLPNRLYFTDHLSQALARAQRANGAFALLLFDVDGFKRVNDSLGHQAGDALLGSIATRVGRRLRKTDFLARLGGDEFVVLLEPLHRRADAERVAEELIRNVAGLNESGTRVPVGISVGIVLVDATTANTISADELLQRADRAMYEAKRAGKGCHRFAG